MFNQEAFRCPHCNVYSRQVWTTVEFTARATGLSVRTAIGQPYYASVCDHCQKPAFWLDKDKLIYPTSINNIPLPSLDMPDDIKDDFMEARKICNNSPRAAAALLRLCIQKLMPLLGEKGTNINDDIKSLVSKGLPVQIQQSLDCVRVIGNNAVHPGQLNIQDNPEITHALFDLVNIIITVMITQPKQIENIYNSLPNTAIAAIEKRDK